MTNDGIAMIVAASILAASNMHNGTSPGFGYANYIARDAKLIASEMIEFAQKMEDGQRVAG